MTWLNNPTNNEFQIRSKLDIDITKLYWDGSPYGIDKGFKNWDGYNTNSPGYSYGSYGTENFVIPLRFGNKKVLCGSDFVNISNPTNDIEPYFIIDTSSYDLSLYVYHIKVNANIKGFFASNLDYSSRSGNYGILNNFSHQAPTNATTAYSGNPGSGLRLVFLNSDSSGSVINNISRNLTAISTYNSISDTTAPYTGRIQCLSGFPYHPTESLSIPNQSTTRGTFYSSFKTLNCLYSLHSLNTAKEANLWYPTNGVSSNLYSGNVINPTNHMFFDFFLIKEYTRERTNDIELNKSNLSSSIITKTGTTNNRSTIDYPYMCFFICSSNYFSNYIKRSSPFMYFRAPEDLNKNDIISNVEIEIIRYPR